jgi:glucosylceramidase
MLNPRHLPGITLFLLALVAAAPSQAQNPCRVNASKVMNQLRYPTNDLTLLTAHRGVHAMWNDALYDKYAFTPENSLESIQNAANECIEIIEIDIRQTQDGVPILSHDQSWGRETNVGYGWGAALYNPNANTGPNPMVNSWKLADTRTLKLRTNASTSAATDHQWSKWDEHPPTLQEVINFMNYNGIQSVLAIDVKDMVALQNAWYVIAKAGYYNRVFFKVDVQTIFPNAQAVDNFFGNLHYVTENGANPDSNFVKIMPVYNTQNISPVNNMLGVAAGEDKVRQSAYSFYAGNKPWYIGQEVNIKENGGILQQTQNDTWASYSSGSHAIFNPRREYQAGGRTDSSGAPEYYRSTGACCAVLSEYYYYGGNDGLPSDHADNRSEYDFVTKTQRFDVITTDNVLNIRKILQDANKRNVSRIRD